ncbi:MAG TPA: hypothetical protein VFL91_21610 [Thermomicrobiales bacterium]|nr:hypothetical protein [Thermomicrobiales bacterium]
MAKRRTVLFLSPETACALTEYGRLHRARFRSTSEAADHLLRRALLEGVDEGTEGLLAPLLRRVVQETTRRELHDQLAPLLHAQTDRLAGLLVRGGQDAASAYGVGVAVLERLTGDAARARAIAEDVRLRAGARYAPPAGAGRGTPR